MFDPKSTFFSETSSFTFRVLFSPSSSFFDICGNDETAASQRKRSCGAGEGRIETRESRKERVAKRGSASTVTEMQLNRSLKA